MNERIKKLRTRLDLTQKQFGSKIGLRSSISEIESGKAPLTDRTIITICSVFNVNENWIRTGKGKIFIDSWK